MSNEHGGPGPNEKTPMTDDAQTSEASPASIADVLAQFAADCPALKGAVVATPDGLLLGASSSFRGDTPAAVAVSMIGRLEHDLRLLMPTNMRESLLWADVGVWYMCRLPAGQVLLAHTAQDTMAGALRLAGQVAAARLAPLMQSGD